MINFRYFLSSLLLLVAFPLLGQIHIIPQPNSLLLNPKKCSIKYGFEITTALPELNFAQEELNRIVSNMPRESTTNRRKVAITLSLDSLKVHSLEAYELKITPNNISIKAKHPKGIYYGVTTLRQILEQCQTQGEIPCLLIEDAPRYEFRGLMLDPARHYLPIDDIKAYIDQMALYKLNTLQLHLTDDQGWRLEIPNRPLLTTIGAKRSAEYRVEDNEYYRVEELRELVQYAQLRGIEIIPEIDIPGHTGALLTAYPNLRTDIHRDSTFVLGQIDKVMLSASTPETYELIEDVIQTLAHIFPLGTRLHLGGDESEIERNWAISPEHKALMNKEGMKTPSELMQYFFARTLEIARKYGFRPMLWCELDNIYPPAERYLLPYPKDVTLVSWRAGLTPKSIELSAISGNPVVLAPGESAYFDYPQYPRDLPEHNNWGMPITTLEQAYTWDLKNNIGTEQDTHIIGVMGTLWGEAIKDIDRANYMTYPRALALAEIGWTERRLRSWTRFRLALPSALNGLLKRGVAYRVPFEVYKHTKE